MANQFYPSATAVYHAPARAFGRDNSQYVPAIVTARPNPGPLRPMPSYTAGGAGLRIPRPASPSGSTLLPGVVPHPPRDNMPHPLIHAAPPTVR